MMRFERVSFDFSPFRCRCWSRKHHSRSLFPLLLLPFSLLSSSLFFPVAPSAYSSSSASPRDDNKKRGEGTERRGSEQRGSKKQGNNKASERSIAFHRFLPLPPFSFSFSSLTCLRPESPQSRDQHGRAGHTPHALAAVDRQLPRVQVLVDDMVGVVPGAIVRRRRRRCRRRSHHASSSGARGAGSLGLVKILLCRRDESRGGQKGLVVLLLLLLTARASRALSRGHRESRRSKRKKRGREKKESETTERWRALFLLLCLSLLLSLSLSSHFLSKQPSNIPFPLRALSRFRIIFFAEVHAKLQKEREKPKPGKNKKEKKSFLSSSLSQARPSPQRLAAARLAAGARALAATTSSSLPSSSSS